MRHANYSLLTTIIFFLCLSQNVISYVLPVETSRHETPITLNHGLFTNSGEDNENEKAVYDSSDDISTSNEKTNDIPNLQQSDEENDFTENDVDILKKLEDEIRQDQEIVHKSAALIKLLEDIHIGTLPIVYVEDPTEHANIKESPQYGVQKRTRYYRRYPWKRQNSRYRAYEADTRYLCVPSRDDVFKLLVGLHENRNGNHQKTVNFCNRKRPAKAIFTNIRFLG